MRKMDLPFNKMRDTVGGRDLGGIRSLCYVGKAVHTFMKGC